MQDYCECLGVEVNERINILDMLKECKIFTAYRQAELQRISTVRLHTSHVYPYLYCALISTCTLICTVPLSPRVPLSVLCPYISPRAPLSVLCQYFQDYKSLDKSVKDVMEKMDQRMKDLDRANSTSTSDPSARDDITDVGDMEIESDGEGQDSKSQSNPPGMILTPPMATTYQAGPMQPSPPTIAYQEQAPPLSSGQHMASPALRARLEGPRFQGRGVAGPPQPGRGSVMTRPLPPPGRGMTTRPLLPPARGVARPLPPPARGMVRPLPPPARGMVRPLPSPVRGMARPLPPPVRGMARPLPPQGRGPTRPLPPQGRGMARPLPPHQRPPLQGQNGNSSPVQPAHGHRTMPPFRVPPIIKPGPPEANQSHTISSNAVMYNRPNQPEATAMEENSTPDHVKPSLDERLKDMLLNKKFEGTVLKEQDDSKAYSPTEHDHTLVNTDGEMSPAPTPSPVDSPETSPKPNMDNPILKALYKSRASPEPKPSSLVPDYDENDELSSSDLKNILNQVISSEPSNTRSDGVEQPPPASGPEKPAIPTPSDIKITPTLTNLLDEIFPKISQSLMNRKRKQESDNIPSKISRLDEGGPGLPSKISHPGNVSRLDGPPGLPGNISRLDAPPGLPGNVSRLDGPPGLPGNVSRLDGPPRLPGNVSRLDGPPGLPGNVSRLDGPPRLPGNVSRLDGPPGLPGNVSRLDGPPGLPGNVSRLDGPYPPPPPPPPPQQTPLFPGSPRVRSPFERPRFPLYPPGGPMHMPKQGVGPPRPRLFSPYERVPSNHLMENSQGQHFSMRPNSYQEPRLYNPAMRPRGYGQFHPRFV